MKIDKLNLFIKRYERDNEGGKEKLETLKRIGIKIEDFFDEKFNLNRFSKMINMSVTEENNSETSFYLNLFKKKNEDGEFLSLECIQGIANFIFCNEDYKFLISKKRDGTYWTDKEIEAFYYLILRFSFEDFKFLTEIRKDGRYWNEKEIDIIQTIMFNFPEVDICKIKDIRTDGRYFEEEELKSINCIEFFGVTSYYFLNPKADGTYFTKNEMKKISDLVARKKIDTKDLQKIFKTGDLSVIA